MAAARHSCAAVLKCSIHSQCLQVGRHHRHSATCILTRQMAVTESGFVRILVNGNAVTIPTALVARSDTLCVLGSDGVVIISILTTFEAVARWAAGCPASGGVTDLLADATNDAADALEALAVAVFARGDVRVWAERCWTLSEGVLDHSVQSPSLRDDTIDHLLAHRPDMTSKDGTPMPVNVRLTQLTVAAGGRDTPVADAAATLASVHDGILLVKACPGRVGARVQCAMVRGSIFAHVHVLMSVGDSALDAEAVLDVKPLMLAGVVALHVTLADELDCAALSGCGLGAVVCALTYTSVSLPLLGALELSGLNMGASGASALASKLCGLIALTLLDLSSNALGSTGMAALAPSLACLTQLKVLDLRAHAAWRRRGTVSALEIALAPLQLLTSLGLTCPDNADLVAAAQPLARTIAPHMPGPPGDRWRRSRQPVRGWTCTPASNPAQSRLVGRCRRRHHAGGCRTYGCSDIPQA